MGVPPDSWLDTMSIGRSPSYFSFNNPLASIIAAFWECQLKTVWYFDVSGFCLTPYIPYAWQPIGSVIEIPTSTHHRRLNVLGFMNRHNDLYPYMMEGKVDTP